MKPAPFEYRRPETVEEVLALLARYGGEAKLLAGGQSLVPTMNFRLAQPAVLIDLNRVPGLDAIEETIDGLRLGAMARQRAVERSPVVARGAPLLHQALPWIAHPQIRNRGTVGGSLAHADPAAELPAVMLALEATVVARSPEGARRIGAAEFFPGLFATALEPGELLTEIIIPARPAGSGSAFEEVARRHGDFALVGVAAEVVLARDGTCGRVRVALLSVGDGPVLAVHAAQALEQRTPDAAAIAQAAAAAAAEDIDPPGDIHASAGYRRQLAAVLVRRALTRAVAKASER